MRTGGLSTIMSGTASSAPAPAPSRSAAYTGPIHGRVATDRERDDDPRRERRDRRDDRCDRERPRETRAQAPEPDW